MANTFFSQLDSDTLCALLGRTPLRDAALVQVGPELRIEQCSEQAAELTGLHPLERIDQLLSEPARDALRDCVEHHALRTVFEEIDGASYRLELLPCRKGALLAFQRDDRTEYDGNLRVLHARTAQALGVIMGAAGQMDDGKLRSVLRCQCLRIQRLFDHSDFLHDTPSIEQMRLSYADYGELLRTVAAATQKYTKQEIVLRTPENSLVLIESRLVQMALYNLLTNAVRVSPPGEPIEVTLRDSPDAVTVTVSDRGPGLDLAQFSDLLAGWRTSVSFNEYISFVRRGAPLGLGLPLALRVAQVHGGTLLLSAREGGGSELHFQIAHLTAEVEKNRLYSPVTIQTSAPLDEIELSVLWDAL